MVLSLSKRDRSTLFWLFFPSKMLWKSAISFARFRWKLKSPLLMKYQPAVGACQLWGCFWDQLSLSTDLWSSLGLLLAPAAQRSPTKSCWARKGLCSWLIYSPWIIQPLVIALSHGSDTTTLDFVTDTSKWRWEGQNKVPKALEHSRGWCWGGDEPGQASRTSAAQGLHLQYIP